MTDRVVTTTEPTWRSLALVFLLAATPFLLVGVVDLVVPMPEWLATPTVVFFLLGVVGGLFGRQRRRSALLERLRRTGRRGQATITSVSQHGGSTNNQTHMLRLELRVIEGDERFTAVHLETVDALHLARLQKGSQVPVVWAPDDRATFFLDLDR